MINYDDIETQLERAKDKARKLHASEFESEKDAELMLRFLLSRIYNIPLFSEYFNDRNIEELAFEIEMHRLASQPKEKTSSEVVNANKQEAEELFNDWVEASDSEPPKMSEEELARMSKFMETGKFEGE